MEEEGVEGVEWARGGVGRVGWCVVPLISPLHVPLTLFPSSISSFLSPSCRGEVGGAGSEQWAVGRGAGNGNVEQEKG
jgi:hypothetical protein